MPDAEARAALARLLEIRGGRASGQRYWAFPFGEHGEGVAGGPTVAQPRQISIHEAMAKLRALEVILGGPVAAAVARWEEQPAATRHTIALLLGRLGRSERPRWLSDRTYSWRRLEETLFQVATQAQAAGEPFGAVPPAAALARELHVGLRTLQKGLARIRRELAEAPGLRVRVNLWMGEIPANHPTLGGSPGLWVSRWGAREGREAATAGLMPADTAAQARAARRELWGRRRERQ